MSQQTSKVIAQIQGVSKRYKEVLALDKVDLTLKSGQVLSILGPNGAGKTTLINSLLGRLSLSDGEISIFGLSPGDIQLKRLCGAMLQVANLPETLTIKEHIQLFQSYYAKPMQYQFVLEYAGLAKVQNKLSKNLSGGQKQRLLFALAICGNPKLLFLDEPSVGMDVSARKSLWKAIKNLKAHGTSIILTTHYLEEADFLSDRIVMLNQGRVIQEGTPQQIKAQVNCQRIRFASQVSIEELASVKGVTQVQRVDHLFELQTPKPTETLKHLLSIVDDVSELTVSGAALEDAFLQLNEASESQQSAA